MHEFLGLLDGPPAGRALTVAALLASEYADDELLRELPAVAVLKSGRQVGRVAAVVAAICGEDEHRWAAWERLAGSAGTETFGKLLKSLAESP